VATLTLGSKGRKGLLVGGVSAGLALAILAVQPAPIHLSEREVTVSADPDRVFQQMTSFGEGGPRIVERGDNHIVAEFSVRVGFYQATTRERITLDPDHRKITFDQLRSPFFSVRTARETFELRPGPKGDTVITLHGTLWPQLGAFGWLVTRFVVRPRWDRIEETFLERLRQGFSAPAA
jgi:hypothetical protein